ncbi:Flagellar motor rotation protein MotB [Candidatus Nitrotoga sp. BS]|uniref:flagellar motor protein MotD n=1 Tax=Candidatus Nitrotoga sp. BS TaxID=2890408 RepID=UPI001EF1F647|nr:flagellar motor protein MotD [Candidatus Nitrotoga sp. BS]CAH1198347.1 Flagellar motor rotation protein MotB [Candidatus Nitrotoga sp. BS]
MARRARHREHENHDRWLISYADFITLLFAFFVVMYAMSSVNESKYQIFSASLTSAFGKQIVKPAAIVPASEQGLLLKSLVDRRNAKLAQQQQEAMQDIAKKINQVMSALVKNGQVSVMQTNRGVAVEINASALFNQGNATLQGGAISTLVDVAKVLEPVDLAIEVEGHTDDIPIATEQFPSNWELSSARASSVVRLFIEHGLMPKNLKAIGSAANHPVTSNDTADERAQNRRITVTILSPIIERTEQEPKESVVK